MIWRRTSLFAAMAVLILGASLRSLWLTADPATQASTTVGVVWHDEGAWVHNARNQALWGVWRTDEWNPMYIAPVFTALEAAAFKTFGVGTWQARTVPVASGQGLIRDVMSGKTHVIRTIDDVMGGRAHRNHVVAPHDVSPRTDSLSLDDDWHPRDLD